MIQLSRLRPLRSKKYIILVSVVLSLLILGGYVLWSKQMWEQYSKTYTQWHQQVQSDIKVVDTLPTITAKEQDALLVRLDGLSERISSEQAGLCSANPFVSWQQRFIAKYKDAQIDCRKKTTDAASFQKQLANVTAYIKDDRELAKVIATVAPSGELADGAWGDQVATWNKAIDAAGKPSVSAAFRPTRQQALDQMTAVKVAWQELIAAHLLKDKAKYVEAQNKLGISYDGLNSIVVESEKRLLVLLNTK